MYVCVCWREVGEKLIDMEQIEGGGEGRYNQERERES